MEDKDRKEIDRLIHSMRIPQLDILIAYYKNKKNLTDYQLEILKMANLRKFLLEHQNEVILGDKKCKL